MRFAKKIEKELTQEQVIQKLESYCAYRERCESEIRQKLYQLNVNSEDYNFYLNYLRENNFLNEERYVAAFARGKFNIKSWGRRKIVQELRGKHINEKQINGQVQIDEGIYFLRLQEVVEKKWKSLKDTDPLKKKQKVIRYALSKGYEPQLIDEALKTISV